MASDDDLRDKLTKALSEFEVFTDSDGHLSIRMKDPWTNKERVDALMPVVREALADAWDHGHRTSNPVIPDTHRDVINPWKQP